MSQRPVTRLVIPTQSSSPNSQPTTPNGRPSAWSWSAQRKMARLYLYTTLPAEKIRAIINAHSPDKTIKYVHLSSLAKYSEMLGAWLSYIRPGGPSMLRKVQAKFCEQKTPVLL